MNGYNIGSDAAAPGRPAGAPGRLRRGRSRACGSQARGGGRAVLPRRCRREPKGLLLYGGEFYPPLARKHRNLPVRPGSPRCLFTGTVLEVVTGDTATPGGAPGHTRDTHTGHAGAQGHTDHTDEPHKLAHKQPNSPTHTTRTSARRPKPRPTQHLPVKRHRGEPGHTRDTRTHKGTRTAQTNLTTIQTHQQLTTRTSARRPKTLKPRPTLTGYRYSTSTVFIVNYR